MGSQVHRGFPAEEHGHARVPHDGGLSSHGTEGSAGVAVASRQAARRCTAATGGPRRITECWSAVVCGAGGANRAPWHGRGPASGAPGSPARRARTRARAPRGGPYERPFGDSVCRQFHQAQQRLVPAPQQPARGDRREDVTEQHRQGREQGHGGGGGRGHGVRRVVHRRHGPHGAHGAGRTRRARSRQQPRVGEDLVGLRRADRRRGGPAQEMRGACDEGGVGRRQGTAGGRARALPQPEQRVQHGLSDRERHHDPRQRARPAGGGATTRKVARKPAPTVHSGTVARRRRSRVRPRPARHRPRRTPRPAGPGVHLRSAPYVGGGSHGGLIIAPALSWLYGRSTTSGP